ncbi:hypothetical protein QUF58_00355 [Anaerolineales bacterium HSG24]|nr:hypothetical protein [Anaerolineales bacterium HSG24]
MAAFSLDLENRVMENIWYITLICLMLILLMSACQVTMATPTISLPTATVSIVLPPSPTLSPTITPLSSVTIESETIAIPQPSPTVVPDPPGPIQLISRKPDGFPSNGDSTAPDISADGRWLLFVSRSNDLVANDTNQCQQKGQTVGCADIFLHDRQTGLTERVSVASDGSQANADSFSPRVSGDGMVIVFASHADNLVVDDANEVSDIFIHYRPSGITRLLSGADDGTMANSRSFAPFISQDGRWVVFTSEADNLIFGDTNELADIFLYNHDAGQLTRVSLTDTGQQSQQNSWPLGISAHGERILFGSAGSLSDGLDRVNRLYLHENENKDENENKNEITRQIIQDQSGLGLFSASLSADGRWLVYQTFMGHWDITRYDLETNTEQQANLASNGQPANFDSFSPVISADGSRVAFSSRATNLTPYDTNRQEDIFLHDYQTEQTTLLSQNEAGVQGDGLSDLPAISADGEVVAFVSMADILTGQATQNRNIYVAQLDLRTINRETNDSGTALNTLQFNQQQFSPDFPISQVKVSPDNEQLAVVGQGGAFVYTLPDVELYQPWWIGSIDDVTWSPDSYSIATTSQDGAVPVWDVGTGGKVNLLGLLIGDDEISWQPVADWSPDGHFVASNSIDEQVYLWRVVSATAEIILNEDGAYGVNAVAWSPDGQQLAVSDSDAVRVWEIESKQSRVILPSAPYRVSELAWSEEGTKLAFGSELLADGRGLVHVKDLSGGMGLFEGPTHPVNSVAWLPDEILVSGSADGVWLWDVSTGETMIFDGLGTVTTVDWSADGRYLVAGTAEGTIYIWSVVTE